MTDQHTPLESPNPTEPDRIDPAPDSDTPQTPPPRPEYTKKQRVIALLGAIFVVIVTLMYTYSLATGDLFFR